MEANTADGKKNKKIECRISCRILNLECVFLFYWKMGHRSERAHTHKDFANYQKKRLEDVIDFELGKDWIYTSSDTRNGHKARKANNSFSYVD